MRTLGWPWHLDYAQSYRGLMLLIDIGLFALVWRTLTVWRVKLPVMVGALLYYSLTTLKANHFVYDKIDWAFAAATFLGVVAPIVWRSKSRWFIGWVGFFIGVALKYINAPLVPVYAVLERKEWRKAAMAAAVAFLLIWGLPLAIYRSSLSVSFVYFRLRGLQVESVPATIVATVNRFTKSEQYVEVFKNYDIIGPVSQKVRRVFDVVFPSTLILWIGYALWTGWRAKSREINHLRMYLTMGYIFLFMLTSKVLSTPFLLWHIPFLTAYPFKSLREQLKYTIPSFIIIAISMTGVTDRPIGIFSIHLIIGWLRSLLFVYLLGMWIFNQKSLQKFHQGTDLS